VELPERLIICVRSIAQNYLMFLSALCFQRLEVTDDGDEIDIEGGDDQRDVEKQTVVGSVEEVEVEEFFVKYKNLSVSHD